MRVLITMLVVLVVAQPCWAWSECGHNIIAILAYDLLSKDEQRQLQTLLAPHPRFSQDFAVPENVAKAPDLPRWVMGRAGYWPDIARSQPAFDRPNWHFQLGAALVIGKVEGVPITPGSLPEAATLETKELHIAQAVELCRRVLRDRSRSDADRALAICWLAHLVGDAHQPCHAGGMYAERAFPEGDLGANLIPVKQGRNLHAVWDSLLGGKFDAGDIERRARLIVADEVSWREAALAASRPKGLDPLVWLKESADASVRHVYSPEVLAAVDAKARGLTSGMETIDLPEAYLANAGKVARIRAAFAAHRLACVLRADLQAAN